MVIEILIGTVVAGHALKELAKDRTAPTLFKKSGVFCKVESSPLLEIIYPYGEQSLQKKRGIFVLISGFFYV